MDLTKLVFDEKELIPAVVQDFNSGEVLTVAYMNKESLDITLKEKRTCFWSRSRQELWRKGETSGNIQHVVSITADCDYDTLLVKVLKDGPACHLGNDSCFSNEVCSESGAERFKLVDLSNLLIQRNKERPEGSYTTYLFEKGREKILKKIGEESTEVVIAAMKESKRETVYEIADLSYHVLVLMVEMGISTDAVLAELASRHVIDKKVKQETLK